MPFRCAFTIRSDTRYLSTLRDWVAAVARVAGHDEFPRRAVVPCSLALIEAVDNAIFHAHGHKKDLPISVSLALERRRIVMEVIDRGEGIGKPKLPKPDELVTHGRGLFIIHNVMSDVTSKVSKGRHKIRMVYTI